MDFLTNRRVGTTYGRSKRVLIHDLFESRNGNLSEQNIVSSDASQLAGPSDIQGRAEIQRTDSIAKNYGSSRPSPISSSSSDIQELSNARDGDKPNVLGSNADLYDVISSEDGEDAVPRTKSRKRQKITQPVRRARPANISQIAILDTNSSSKSSRTVKPKGKVGARSVSEKVAEPINDRIEINKADESTARPRQKVVDTIPKRPKADQSSRSHAIPAQLAPREMLGDKVVLVDDYTGTDVSEQPSDQSGSPTSETPKGKRMLQTRYGGDVPSPSQLGLPSLRFTPDKSSSSSRPASPDSVNNEAKAPHRARPRLIDRLDAPEQKPPRKASDASKTSDVEKEIPENNNRDRGRVRMNHDISSTTVRPVSSEGRSQSSQNRTTYTSKARTTYAKERSHLSEMVDSLSMPNISSSQKSSQGLILHTTKSNLASQLDLDDDDSDGQFGIKPLKSIHELRQAGAINRFDREAQALFEDIESPETSKKSLRIQTLIKLVKRLKDDAFARYFVSTGQVKRLITFSKTVVNLSSAILITVALYNLSKADNFSEGLGQIFSGISSLAPLMLMVGKSIREFTSEKEQNLTKSDIKRLVAFEEDAVEQNLISGYQSSAIRPDELILTCLNEVLRELTRLGIQTIPTSSETYSGILQLLDRYAKQVGSPAVSGTYNVTVEKALSLLEAYSIALDSTKLDIAANQYQTLGKSLATIQQHTGYDQSNIEKAVLRVVVSLSNNKPDMCHILGKTSVLKAVFLVVESNFVRIADHAEHDQILDQEKLDSVILALGCLLNFSECDSNSRKRLASSTEGSHTYLERLVSIFNSQVAKAQEVITQEQGQVLVAFGYLSMLLCTMSLDPDIRLQTTRLLKDRSFSELCAAAEMFFSHLRTLESISEDDGSMSAFTARFNTILETIRSTPV